MFDLIDEAFDQMPLSIQVLVILSLLFAILPWRNHRLHASLCDALDQSRVVVAFVSDQCLGLVVFDQLRRLWAVMTLTSR